MEAHSLSFKYMLFSLPPEVITPIADYLNGDHITRLYICGDKNLMSLLTMRGGVKSFRIKFNRVKQCCIPPLVYMLPQLRCLDLDCAYYLTKFTPYPDWDPYKLPSSLQSISVNLWQPEPYVEGPYTVEPYSNPLSELFPRLEFISSVLLPSVLDIRQLSFLPALTRIELPDELEFDLIRHLPRSLLELEIMMTPEIEKIDWSIDPLFPPDLTALKIFNVYDSACFKYLPRPLTSLHLETTLPEHQPCRWKEEHFSQLPSTLKQLETAELGKIMSLGMIQRLPRELEALRCYRFSMDTHSLIPMIHALPNTLTSIEHFEPPDLEGLNLEEVQNIAKLKFGRLKSCDRELSKFFSGIGWLPEHLEELQRISVDYRGKLPDSIETLSLTAYTGPTAGIEQTPFALPAKLTYLNCSSDLHPVHMDSILQHRYALRTISIPLLAYQVLLLPPTLKVLIWYKKQEQNGADFSVAHLPLLKQLTILSMPPLAPKCSLFSTLPSSLKKIRFDFPDPYAIQGAELRHFNSQRLPRLLCLSIRGLLALRDEHLSTFPESLTSLHLGTIQNPQLTEICLLSLPVGLISLNFPPFPFDVKHDHLLNLNKFSKEALGNKVTRRKI